MPLEPPDKRIQRSCHQLISCLRWGSGFTQRFRYLPQLEVRSLYTPFEDNRFENNHFENNHFENNDWDFNLTHYEAWKTGHTGFPIVDAAARCLSISNQRLASAQFSRSCHLCQLFK